jgi:hypothetical protein
MKFPSASRYNEAVQNPNLYFSDPEVKQRRVHSDALGLPEVLSGGFAFTYRFSGTGGDIAVRCFHRNIPDLFERYQAISAFLQKLRSSFFVDFTFAERGVSVDGKDFPVVKMLWIEGETLLGYVSRIRSDRAALGKLRKQLLAFAEEAESQGYAHGDIQHRNLMVTPDGSLKVVDYDSMYVPALRHLKSADAGHPNFQPPSRSPGDFGPRVDRFPLAVVDLSLEALMERPELFEQFHRGENLILSRTDFINPSSSPVLDAIARIPHLVPRVAAFVDMCQPSARDAFSLKEFCAGYSGRSTAMPATSSPPQRGDYASDFDVADGMDFKKALQFVGQPVELIGQVLQLKEQSGQGVVLLRFGVKFAETPAVVVPQEVFSAWPGAKRMHSRPWVSARGILRAHTSWGYSTVQVLVREASDIEVLPGKEEARIRLGHAPAISASPSPPPTPSTGGIPSWMEEVERAPMNAAAERRRQEEARRKAEQEAAFKEAQARMWAEHKAKEEVERARMNAAAERRRQEEVKRKEAEEAAFQARERERERERRRAEAAVREEAVRRAAEQRIREQARKEIDDSDAQQERHKAHPAGKLAEYEIAKPNWLALRVAIVVTVLIVLMIALGSLAPKAMSKAMIPAVTTVVTRLSPTPKPAPDNRPYYSEDTGDLSGIHKIGRSEPKVHSS